jgi:hypothetical protein
MMKVTSEAEECGNMLKALKDKEKIMSNKQKGELMGM